MRAQSRRRARADWREKEAAGRQRPGPSAGGHPERRIAKPATPGHGRSAIGLARTSVSRFSLACFEHLPPALSTTGGPVAASLAAGRQKERKKWDVTWNRSVNTPEWRPNPGMTAGSGPSHTKPKRQSRDSIEDATQPDRLHSPDVWRNIARGICLLLRARQPQEMP